MLFGEKDVHQSQVLFVSTRGSASGTIPFSTAPALLNVPVMNWLLNWR
jgi:hypothetical protein